MPDPTFGISTGITALSTGLGLFGASEAANAQEQAAEQSAQAARDAAATQKYIYDTSRKDFSPYMTTGYQGLGQLTGQSFEYIDPYTGEKKQIQGSGQMYDLMKGVGEQPSYEKTVTEQLGNYAQSPQYQAQNAIAQQNLQRQLNARGLNYGATGASAGAELSRQLTASDYDKYKADLASKYAALQGEYSQRRDINQNQYQQLMDMVKVGQGAAGSVQQAGSVYGNQAADISKQLANAYTQQGQAQAGFYSGLGNVIPGATKMFGNTYSGISGSGFFGGGK